MSVEQSWLDYFTPISFNPCMNNSSNNKKKLDDEVDDDEILNQATWAWNIGQNQKQYQSEYGLIFEVSVPTLIGRYFLVHEPKNVDNDRKKMPLVIFFHGLNSSAWFMALVRTKWIEQANAKKFLLVFGQGQGKQFRKGPKLNHHGQVQFGDDLFWEIQEPKTDFIYFDSILKYMNEKYSEKLDLSRIYYIGYSNGGLFSCNVAIHYGGHVIAAICNHCGGYGGLGYHDEELLNPNEIKKPVPIYILTGTDDNYLLSCEKARKKFEKVGCPVTMEIMENREHRYYVDKEEDIWKFFAQHSLNNI